MKTGAFFYAVFIFALLVSNFSFGNLANPPKKRLVPSFTKLAKASRFVAVIAPEIRAAGDQSYCPLTTVNIVTTVSIIGADSGDTSTNAVYIQISSGYINGEDKLLLNPASSNPSIVAEWNPNEGKLTLKSPTDAPVSYLDFENAIKNVQFYNSSSTPTGTRNFSISIGQANYLPSNGHYYLYFPDLGISWTNARDKAAATNYHGLKGYLATLTTPDEAQLVGKQSQGAGWIGGSDAETEGLWKWVTGPETGLVFWNGNFFNGSTPNFAFWNMGEPNQAGEEDYAHITAPGVGTPGSWNDLKIDGEAGGDYQPKGYIVEYGGTPGDPDLHLSASTTLTIAPYASITSTSPASRCDAGTVTLHATASAGTINWYNVAVGGTIKGTGPDFTTPLLNTTTTYYAEVPNSTCASSRTAVEATINNSPTITNIQPQVPKCGPGSFTLAATPSAGSINWYSEIGGTIIGIGTSYITPLISANTTYYAEAINNGCTSSTKVAVPLVVYPLPAVFDQTVEKCTLGFVTLDASIPNMKYLWNTGETTKTIIVSAAGTYTVDVTSPAPESCSSRKKINVIINNALDINHITSTTPASRCDAGTVTLQAVATAGTINWYDATIGGTKIGTGTNFTTPNINTTTTYYVETATANCSSSRTPVEAKINITPTIENTDSPQPNCGPGVFDLSATPTVGSVNWYSQIDGTVVGSGPSYTTPTINTNTTYYAEATNNGCTNGIKVAVPLKVFATPAVTDQTVEKCSEGNVTLDASISNMKYLWNTGEITQTIIASAAGSYTVDVTSPAPENCTSRKTITVFENNDIITNTTPASRCDAGTVTLEATATAGTINWYDAEIGGNNIGTGSNFTTPNINATTTYYVETASPNCSSSRTAVEAKINITPTITNVDSPAPNCGPEVFNLTATPTVGNVNWYSQIDGMIIGSGLSYSTPTISSNTTYYAEAINNGCTNNTKTPINLIIYPLPAVTDEAVGKCSSSTVALDASIPNMSYFWSTGETTQTIETTTAGIYTVDVTSLAPENCSNRKTITVFDNSTPEIKNVIIDETTVSIELVKTEDYFEYSIDGNNFQSSNVFTNAPTGLQTAYVRDLNGCNTDTEPFIVFVVPKFFTPNDDTYNDSWKAKWLVDYPMGEVIIFDRYGKIITVLNRHNPSWDGTLNKRPLPSSDYWYVIKLDPNSPERRGHFSLKR